MNRELLQRYVEGDVTTEEAEVVVEWLDADEENAREYMSLQKLYTISLLNKPEQNEIFKEPGKAFRLRKIGFELLKIAAILLLFWGIQYFFNLKQETEDLVAYQTFYVPPGQRAELILPDSSKVWLNAKTSITYPTHFENGNREIRLEGEAYFDVKHNKQQPFIVKTEKMEIEVFGTEFNVSAYRNSSDQKVALIEGSVELKSAGIREKYKMKPSEQVEYKSGKLYVSAISQYDYFKWKDGILSFTNESVESIIEKLQLYFDIRIEVQKRSLLEHRYNGKFRMDDGVEQVLKVLQLEHNFTYTRDREQNIITIK